MINKCILLIITVAFMTFPSGCGRKEGGNNPFVAPAPLQIWNGIWVSSKVIASGTMSLTVTQSGTTFSGSITLTGSPCFSTSPITGWTVTGNAVSWSAPEIGNFTGIISGDSISGTYSVTSAGACFSDTGTFSVTS
jgi:hypothetical protein